MKQKWKPEGVSDSLQMVGRGQVIVVSGNGGELPLIQSGDGLRERKVGIEIGVVGAAAIPGPKTRIHGELHEIREPRLPARPVRRTALQSAELIQVDWVRPLRRQVGVYEGEMSELIVSIVMNVLVHVLIKYLKRLGVRRIPGSSWTSLS